MVAHNDDGSEYKAKPDTMETPAVGHHPAAPSRYDGYYGPDAIISLEGLREPDASEVTQPIAQEPPTIDERVAHARQRGDPTLVDVTLVDPSGSRPVVSAATMTAEERRAYEDDMLARMGPLAPIRNTLGGHPRVSPRSLVEPYGDGLVLPFPEGTSLNAQLIYCGGMNDCSSAVFDLAERINLPSPHSVYRDFHQHSRDGRGILAVAFTDSRDDDARNRHMLSMNFYRNIREKLPPEMRSVLRGSERVNSLNAVGFAPQLFLYVKAVEVGHQDDRPIHDYYLWLLDAGTPEGCSVTLPLFGMDSSDARLAFDIYSGTDDKYESVALLRDLFLADMTPHDDCYNWPAISRTLAHRRNSSSFRGFSLDAFLANYFVIGRLLDPAFAGLAADTFENTYARNILAEYREDLQAMQGSVGDDPTVTVHSRVNVSLFQGNKKRVHDAEGNVLPLPKYSPGPDDVRIRHICLGKLDSRPREILVDFGERLDPDFHGEGAERRYSCRLKMTYTPE